MTNRLLALVITLLAVLAACSQIPPQPRHTGSSDARYVEATVLTSGDEYSLVQVITSVPLRHISAVDAETRLRASLPEGVLASRVGAAKKLLLQGPGHGVIEAIKALEKLDVR
jgi:hypothetical protein